MVRKILIVLLSAVLFLFGLFLPDAVTRIMDHSSVEVNHFPRLASDDYVYYGTPEDRMRALTAYENGSVEVKKVAETEFAPSAPMPDAYFSFLPPLEKGEAKTRTFMLSPTYITAEFAYLESVYTYYSGTVRVIVDMKTGMPLRISLTNARDTLKKMDQTVTGEGFGKIRGIDGYRLLRLYAETSGFTELTDLVDGVSYGASVSTVKMNVKGQPYGLSLTYSTDAGTMFFRTDAVNGQ